VRRALPTARSWWLAGAALVAWLPFAAVPAEAIDPAAAEHPAAPASQASDGGHRLADRLGVGDEPPAAVGVTGAVAPVAGTPPGEPKAQGDSFGFRFDGDRPVSIRSDELQSTQSNGSRTIIFTENVVVVQDDIKILSHRLEAYYPPETNQPSRLIATGDVRMSDARKVVRCDHATYERAKDRLICRGNADLSDDEDCVAGEWIEFDLLAETIKVGGGARVLLGGEDSNPRAGGCP